MPGNALNRAIWLCQSMDYEITNQEEQRVKMI